MASKRCYKHFFVVERHVVIASLVLFLHKLQPTKIRYRTKKNFLTLVFDTCRRRHCLFLSECISNIAVPNMAVWLGPPSLFFVVDCFNNLVVANIEASWVTVAVLNLQVFHNMLAVPNMAAFVRSPLSFAAVQCFSKISQYGSWWPH